MSILKIITVKEVYEVKLDDIRIAELLTQINLRRPEQMITLGKSEGMPYQIGIKPLHFVGYEVHPDAVVSVAPVQLPAQDSPEVIALKAELENLKALQVTIPVKKSGKKKA